MPEQAERQRQRERQRERLRERRVAAVARRVADSRVRTADRRLKAMRALDQVEVTEETWGSIRQAVLEGLLKGITSTLDPFGDEALTFFKRYAPDKTDAEALGNDWEAVSEDLRQAFEDLRDELLEHFRIEVARELRAVADKQPALFDPDSPDELE